MSAAVKVEAPTDAQLAYIRSLCDERGFPHPVVYSKYDASIIIAELLRREYSPPEWSEDVPF